MKVLTVRLLETGAGTVTTELLGLGAARVGNEEGAVEGNELGLDLLLGDLVDVLAVVSDKTAGDGLANGVDLGNVTTTGNADADVDVGELLGAEDGDGLEQLSAEELGDNVGKGDAVDLDHALTGLNLGDSGGGLLKQKLAGIDQGHGAIKKA
jgi:hypothetical protein